jgi:hypothetical protein
MKFDGASHFPNIPLLQFLPKGRHTKAPSAQVMNLGFGQYMESWTRGVEIYLEHRLSCVRKTGAYKHCEHRC